VFGGGCAPARLDFEVVVASRGRSWAVIVYIGEIKASSFFLKSLQYEIEEILFHFEVPGPENSYSFGFVLSSPAWLTYRFCCFLGTGVRRLFSLP
jgi:hypothetical protein